MLAPRTRCILFLAGTVALATGCLPLMLIQATTNLDRFTGEWTYQEGQMDITCEDHLESHVDLTGKVIALEYPGEFEQGHGDILWALEHCRLGYDAVQDTAHIIPAVTCTMTQSDWFPSGTLETTNTGSWVASKDGASLTQRDTQINMQHVQGHDFTVNCTVMLHGRLARKQ